MHSYATTQLISAMARSAGMFRNKMPLSRLLPALLLGLMFLWGPAYSAPIDAPNPSETDTCPVCGMFVAKYPNWIANVSYQDGHNDYFDGPKDLFKYLLDLSKWAPGRKAEDITQIGVTEYYDLTRIDAKDAWYVTGSDVLGPMGHELIPFASQEGAEDFMKDHDGKQILTFDQVDNALLKSLDMDKGMGHMGHMKHTGEDMGHMDMGSRQCCVRRIFWDTVSF